MCFICTFAFQHNYCMLFIAFIINHHEINHGRFINFISPRRLQQK